MRFLLLLLALPLLAAPPPLKVQVGSKIVEIPLERYVVDVLAGESSVFQSKEALKAMAVAARTYAVKMRGRHAKEGFDLCSTTHCQRLDLAAVTPRLESAAADTAGELLWFEGKPAFTPYTKDCGGVSEDAAAIWPDLAASYLKSHADAYCTRAGAAAWQWSADPRQVQLALRSALLKGPRLLDRVAITSRTPSGRASTLTLAGGGEAVRISASSFRFAMGREIGWNTVRGDRYEVHLSNGRLFFEGSGSGHGVGLCQMGAEQRGIAGQSYREILAAYYPGTVAGRLGGGISWQRLSAQGITLWTSYPEQERVALAIAERAVVTISQRTHWTFPSGVEIYSYPDLDSFRNATAEPGWVAAHTEGRRIHLQPVSVLQSRGVLASTLVHELWHVALESQATTKLPLWFQEGLAGYLNRDRKEADRRGNPTEQALRQTGDEARARRAYADAVAKVASLVQTYGEPTVLDWVKRGLPPAVTKANASQPTMKRK